MKVKNQTCKSIFLVKCKKSLICAFILHTIWMEIKLNAQWICTNFLKCCDCNRPWIKWFYFSYIMCFSCINWTNQSARKIFEKMVRFFPATFGMNHAIGATLQKKMNTAITNDFDSIEFSAPSSWLKYFVTSVLASF